MFRPTPHPICGHRPRTSLWLRGRGALGLLAALALSCSGSTGSDPDDDPNSPNDAADDNPSGNGGDDSPPAADDTAPDATEDDSDTGNDSSADPDDGTGESSDDDPLDTTDDDGDTGAAGCATWDASPSVLQRLTRLEYQLTLKELFQLPSLPDVSAVPEDSVYKSFRTNAALLGTTTEHLRGYQLVAANLIDDVLSQPAQSEAVIGCDVTSDACLTAFIERFGRLVYRRPLEPTEVSALADSAQEAASDAADRIAFVTEALLTSPSFLFRVEVGDATEDLSTLTGLELASRLSFSLTGRGPSDALMAQGSAGELDTAEGLRDAARALLADERAAEYFREFFKQWLQFESLRSPNVPPEGWTPALLTDMTAETQRVLDEYAWTPGTDFMAVLTNNFTYVTPELASFYGLPTPDQAGRVEIPAGHHRQDSGILTHAALLSAKGDVDNVAHRGAWVQKTFMCRDLEVPSEVLDMLSGELQGLSYEELLGARNERTECAGCHALIDPIGVGFLQFDDTGKYDASIDPARYGITPALPGSDPAEFDNIGELAAKLSTRAEVAECLAERLFLYTEGREPESQDRCALRQASERFANEQHQFASLLEGLVQAPSFRLRRPAEPIEN